MAVPYEVEAARVDGALLSLLVGQDGTRAQPQRAGRRRLRQSRLARWACM